MVLLCTVKLRHWGGISEDHVLGKGGELNNHLKRTMGKGMHSLGGQEWQQVDVDSMHELQAKCMKKSQAGYYIP